MASITTLMASISTPQNGEKPARQINIKEWTFLCLFGNDRKTFSLSSDRPKIFALIFFGHEIIFNVSTNFHLIYVLSHVVWPEKGAKLIKNCKLWAPMYHFERNLSVCKLKDASKWKLKAKWEKWENHGWRKTGRGRPALISATRLALAPWARRYYGISFAFIMNCRDSKWSSAAHTIEVESKSSILVRFEPLENSLQLIKFRLWEKFSLRFFQFQIFLFKRRFWALISSLND